MYQNMNIVFLFLLVFVIEQECVEIGFLPAPFPSSTASATFKRWLWGTPPTATRHARSDVKSFWWNPAKVIGPCFPTCDVEDVSVYLQFI